MSDHWVGQWVGQICPSYYLANTANPAKPTKVLWGTSRYFEILWDTSGYLTMASLWGSNWARDIWTRSLKLGRCGIRESFTANKFGPINSSPTENWNNKLKKYKCQYLINMYILQDLRNIMRKNVIFWRTKYIWEKRFRKIHSETNSFGKYTFWNTHFWEIDLCKVYSFPLNTVLDN